MATKSDLEILTHEVLRVMNERGVSQRDAITRVLSASNHRDINKDQETMKALGIMVSSMRPTKPRARARHCTQFQTFAVHSLPPEK